MLANHSLPFGSQDELGILWKQSIDAAIAFDKKGLPRGELFAMLRKNLSKDGKDS